MLDRQTEMMLSVANTLTAEDLDYLRGTAPAIEPAAGPITPVSGEDDSTVSESPTFPASDPLRGARERMRTRESKISTTCVGQERLKHDWWPVGTELVGRVGSEVFTGTVVENDQVKSGRSILITSGAAQGKVCMTPTRAAIESTEAYRQAKGLGRGGGVTNGWTFWKPKTAGQ